MPPNPAQIQKAIKNTLTGRVNQSGVIQRALQNSKLGEHRPYQARVTKENGHYVGLDND